MLPIRNLKKSSRCPYAFAVVSGKGGVGKTNTAANLAILAAESGKRVLLCDADLGLSNVDALLGLSPQHTFEEVLQFKIDMREVMVRGPGGITILPASTGNAEMAALSLSQINWLCESIELAAKDFDILIIDAPSGIAPTMQRMVELADELLLLTTPEPTAVMDAYAVVKIFSARRPSLPVKLAVNMISDLDSGERIAAGFHEVVGRFLGREIETVARMPFDVHVPLAVRRQLPYAQCFPQCPATRALRNLYQRLVGGGSLGADAKDLYMPRLSSGEPRNRLPQ